jgi:hypothetical protein
MPQVTGRVTLTLDNDQLRSKPGASLQIGGIEREFDATDQGEAYYKEKSVAASVKCTMVHCADTDLLKLQKFKDGTAQFICDSGPTYTITNAGTAKVGDLQNGEVEITLGGQAAEQ